MQNKNQKRQIKVAAKHQARAHKYVIVPEIKLTGVWLRESGFNYGQSVTVHVEENRLVITSNPV
jgi:hypothetical protein